MAAERAAAFTIAPSERMPLHDLQPNTRRIVQETPGVIHVGVQFLCRREAASGCWKSRLRMKNMNNAAR
jgi:hypothetical protein